MSKEKAASKSKGGPAKPTLHSPSSTSPPASSKFVFAAAPLSSCRAQLLFPVKGQPSRVEVMQVEVTGPRNSYQVWTYQLKQADFEVKQFSVQLVFEDASQEESQHDARFKKTQYLFLVGRRRRGHALVAEDFAYYVVALSRRNADLQAMTNLYEQYSANFEDPPSDGAPSEAVHQHLIAVVGALFQAELPTITPVAACFALRLCLSIGLLDFLSELIPKSLPVLPRLSEREFVEPLRATRQWALALETESWDRYRRDLSALNIGYSALLKERLASKGIPTSAYLKSILKDFSAEIWVDILKATPNLTLFVEAVKQIVDNNASQLSPFKESFRRTVDFMTTMFIDEGQFDAAEVIAVLTPLPDFFRQSRLAALIIGNSHTEVAASTTKVNIYFLYSFSPEEVANIRECRLISQYGEGAANLVPWTGRSAISSLLWRGECPASVGTMLRFQIQVVLMNGLVLRDSATRQVSSEEPFHFVFKFSLALASHTMRFGTPVIDLIDHVLIYLPHVLRLENMLEGVVKVMTSARLFTKYEDLLPVLDSVKQLSDAGDVVQSPTFGVVAMYLLGMFALPRELVAKYWGQFFEVGINSLNAEVGKLAWNQEKVAATTAAGYVQAMNHCLLMGSPNWLQVFKFVQITANNSEEFDCFFAKITEGDAVGILRAMFESGQVFQASFVKPFIRYSRNLQVLFHFLAMLLEQQPPNASEEPYVTAVNELLSHPQRAPNLADIEGLVNYVSMKSPRFRSVISKTLFGKTIESLLTDNRNIGLQWMPLYQKLLLAESWLLPGFNCNAFAACLVTVHRILPSDSYFSLQKLYPDVTSLFRAWLSIPNTLSIREQMQVCDSEVSNFERNGVKERLAAAALEVIEVKVPAHLDFLRLSIKFAFRSESMKLCYFEAATKRVAKLMNGNFAVTENSGLQALINELGTNPDAAPMFAEFLKIALGLLRPCPPDVLKAALFSRPEGLQYLTALFARKDALACEHIAAVAEVLARVGVDLVSGEVARGEFEKVRERAGIICEMVQRAADATRTAAAADLLRKIASWSEQILETQKCLEVYVAVHSMLFSGAEITAEVAIFSPTLNRSYGKSKIKELAVPSPDAKALFDILPRYISIVHSVIFRNLVDNLKKETQNLTAKSVFEILSRAEAGLHEQLHYFTQPPSQIQLHKLIEFVKPLPNPQNELEVLAKIIFPQTVEPLLRVLQHYNRVDEIKEACEVVLECEYAIGFSCQTSLSACKEYIQLINDKSRLLMVSTFLETSEILTRMLCMHEQTTAAVIQVLKGACSHKGLIKHLLNVEEDILTYITEMVGTGEDVEIDSQAVDAFVLVKYFAEQIVSKENIQLLFGTVAKLLADPQYYFITSMISRCHENLPLLEGMEEGIRSMEKKKVKWIESILRRSTAVFDGKNGEVSLTVLLDFGGTVVAKEKEELEALRAQCLLILRYSEENPQLPLEALFKFVQLTELLLRVLKDTRALEEVGAPVPDFNDFRCEIVEGTCQQALRLDFELSSSLRECGPELLKFQLHCYRLTYLFGTHLWQLGKPAQGLWLDFIGLSGNMVAAGASSNNVEKLQWLATTLESLTKKPKSERLSAHRLNEPKLVLRKNQILFTESLPQLERMQWNLLAVYYSAGKKALTPHKVLFCRCTTLTCELQSFLIHVFKAQRAGSSASSKLFALVNCERLSAAAQSEAVKLLENELATSTESTLLIVTSGVKCLLSEYLLSRRKIQRVEVVSQDKLALDGNWLSEMNPNLMVVTSDSAGLGKSYWIEQHALLQKKELLRLPITGELSSRRISADLKRLGVSEECAVCCQVGFVEATQYEVLSDFLFQLTLFKSYKTNTDLFVLPSTSFLYFEVANTVTADWLLSCSILASLARMHIAYPLDISKFEVKDHKDRLVLNYLRALNHSDPLVLRSAVDTQAEVSASTIKTLLDTYLLGTDERSYRSVRIFLDVLSDQLVRMDNSMFAIVENKSPTWYERVFQTVGLQPTDVDLTALRKEVVMVLVESAKEYTVKSVTGVREGQAQATLVRESETMSWENTNHDNFAFIGSSPPLFVYRNVEQANAEMKAVLLQQAIALSQVQGLKKQPTLNDYSKMNHHQLLNILKSTFSLADRQQQANSYVLTADNFLKIILIYVRVQGGVPVVVMGETGCGKTSLLKFTIEYLLGEKLIVVNVHAGTTFEDIAGVLKKASHYPREQRVWIFFDEFNTSACIGTITEIICDRRINGVKVPENLVFVAACNPYRTATSQTAEGKQALLHHVKQLPASIIEYVWDFGAIPDADLHHYINAILTKETIPSSDMFTQMLFGAHRFFRQTQDVSSVSLRDVKRFTILFKWFRETIARKESFPRSEFYIANCERLGLIPPDSTIPIVEKAGLLALHMCYMMRISTAEEKTRFLDAVSHFTAQSGFSSSLLVKAVREEEDDIIARLSLPPDIAINTAFRENFFAMFTCVFNKIPMIICGKPGCSKSLTYQVLFANCKGPKSHDNFLKTLPTLQMAYFQGSKTCTSHAIQLSFRRARRMLSSSLKKISVVIFDELGLAEQSESNSLKALHSELELDKISSEQAVAFVGISNTLLDASKMNRVLYLMRLDPSAQENESTALSICKSLAGDNFWSIVQAVAKTYSRVKEQDSQELFGLRDFYHLIKLVVRQLLSQDNLTEENVAKIVKFAIQRNFGGGLQMDKVAWEVFLQEFPFLRAYEKIAEFDAISLIKANLSDPDSRYLMVMSRSALSDYVLQEYMEVDLAKRLILTGSPFEGDAHSENYARRVLTDIILYMEKGYSIVLKDMDIIYSSLYDLFNQNFGTSKMGKYCRIALGSAFQPRCQVHENFHLIVLMSNPEHQDAPFLNRFEKHSVDLEDILTSEQRAAVEEIEQWVVRLTHPQGKEIRLSLAYIFPTYSKAAVQLSVLKLEDEPAREDVAWKLKCELLASASADVTVLADLCEDDESLKLKEKWRDLHQHNLTEVIDQAVKDRRYSRFVIFTYDVDWSAEMTSSAVLKSIHSFKSEEDLSTDIDEFLSREGAIVYILSLNFATEGRYLAFVKHKVEQKEKLASGTGLKKFCLMVQMQRNVPCAPVVTDFSSWAAFSIEGNQSFNVSEEVLRMTTTELATSSSAFQFEEMLKSLTSASIFQLNYRQGPSIAKSLINEHILFITENLLKHNGLVEAFKKAVHAYLETTNSLRSQNWKAAIFFDGQCVNRSASLHSAISFTLGKAVQKALAAILYKAEQKAVMRSFFSLWTNEEGKTIREIWLDNFSMLNVDSNLSLQTILQSANVDFLYQLDFPFSLDDYELLSELAERAEESRTKFISEFSSRSVTRNHFANLDQSEKLQKGYFSDQVLIRASKERLPPSLNQFLFSMVWDLVSREKHFVLQVWLYACNSQFLTQYCQYETRFSKFTGTSLAKMSTMLNPYQARLSTSPQLTSVSLPVIQFHGERVALKSEPNYFADLPVKDISSAWRERQLQRLDSSIMYIYPTQSTIGQKMLSTWIHGMLQCERDLSEFEGDLSNLSMLRVVNRLPAVEASEDFTRFFAWLCDAIRTSPRLEQQQSKSLLEQEHVRREVVRLLESLKREKPAAAQSFMAYYYAELMRINASYTEQFVEKIELEPEMWKYAKVAIEILFCRSTLQQTCGNLITSRGCGFSSLFDTENAWLVAIEKELKRGWTGKFAILMSDRCVSFFETFSSMEEDSLIASFTTFEKCMAAQDERDSAVASAQLLVASAFLKWYLKLFCKLACYTQLCSARSQDVRASLTESVVHQRIPQNLLSFCRRTAARMAASGGSDVPWLTVSPLQDQQFSYVTACSELFKSTSSTIARMLTGDPSGSEDAFVQCLLHVRTTEDKLHFGLAFVQQVASASTLDHRHLSSCLTANSEALVSRLGEVMANLLQLLVSNFTPVSRFHIPETCSDDERHHVTALWALLVTITAHCQVPSCITSVFYDVKSDPPALSLSNMKGMFIVASPFHPLCEYLHRWTRLDNHHKDATLSLCKNNCWYIYRPEDAPSACPYCASDLSTDYLEISYEAAASYAEQYIQYCLASGQVAGLELREADFQAAGTRGLSELGYCLLHYFVLCYLDFLSLFSEEVEEAVGKGRYQSVNEGLNELLSYDRQYLEYLQRDRSDQWMYRVVTALPALICAHPEEPVTPENRRAFELAFDKTAATCMRGDSNPLAQPHFGLDQPELLSLFRDTQEASLDLLSSFWRQSAEQEAYPVLAPFLQNMEAFALFRCILPIVDLTNSLMKTHNHAITREVAMEKEVAFYLSENKKKLFESFLKAWQNLTFELTYEDQTVPPISLDEHSAMAYFLVDDKGKGLYMSAALATLASIHNSFLDRFAETISQSTNVPKEALVDSEFLPIQKANVQYVFECSLSNIEFLQSCCVNNPDYDSGAEVSFDLHKIELQCLEDLRRARKLRVDDLELFRYQHELSTSKGDYSSVIVEVRKAIPQSELPENTVVARLQTMLKLKERDNEQGFSFFLKDIRDELEYLLCFVKNETVAPDTPIREVCERCKQNCTEIMQTPEILQVPVENLVSAFEFFESQYFPYMRKDMKAVEESESAAAAVSALLRGTAPQSFDIKLAVMRLILRYLAGEVRETESLGAVIEREDLWSESVTAEQRRAVSRSLEGVSLACSLQVYDLIAGDEER